MAYAEAGEFSTSARIGYYQASEAISKGETCVVTPAATPTIAVSGAADVSANYPVVVATAAIASGATGACVEYGEVACDASGNCYKGELVASYGGKVKAAADSATGLPTGVIGRVTEGAADGGVCTVFIGQVV